MAWTSPYAEHRPTTTPCRAALVLVVTLAATGCTDRDVQASGTGDGDTGPATSETGTEHDTNSGGLGTGDTGGADSTGDGDGTTSLGSTSADESDGSDGSDGSTGEPDGGCDLGREQALCGPTDRACAVVVDEAVDETPRSRFWAPVVEGSAGCEPMIHYTTLGDGAGPMSGHLAARDTEGTWSVEPTPFARALHLLHDAGGIVAIGGEDSPDLWTMDERWALQASVTPTDASSWWAAASGTEGQMFLARRSASVLELHTWEPAQPGAFVTDTLDEGPTASTVGVGGGETGSLAWWSGTDEGWALQLSDGAGPVQVVDAADPGDAIAVADGGEHLLYTTSNPLMAVAPSEIRYARRDASGAWNVSAVIADDPDGVFCDHLVPGALGETCDYDYTRVRVQDVVTSDDGDVRMLFTEEHSVGQAVASTDCPGPAASPIPLSFWWCPEGTTTTRLFVGWPGDEGGLAFESVSEAHRIRALDADLDPAGGIHIAALVNDEDDTTGTSVRYLQLR